jgi:excisionase family DNA binding protein
MQGHRTLPAERPAPFKTLADLLAAGELTCSTAQVARWLNVSRPTVIAMARRGELPGKRVGRQWRFSTKALAKAWGLDQADEPETVLAEVPASLAKALGLRTPRTGREAASGGGQDVA